MSFVCPNCRDSVRLRDAACSHCGFSLTFTSVAAHYWRRILEKVRRTANTRCPACRQLVPLTSRACPSCHTEITVEAAFEATVGPTRRKWQAFLTRATPAAKRRVQWLHVIFSALILWALLSEVASQKNWPLQALLSVVYLAFLTVFFLWLTPEDIREKVARRATRLTKLGLLLNFFSVLLGLQIFIGAFWARAMVLAALFALAWVSFFVFTQFIWPLWRTMADHWNLPPQRPVDPTAPQGRDAYYD